MEPPSTREPRGPAGLLSLPDELVIRCLQCLSQQERFQHAALVSKRFQRLCLAPELLRTVTFDVRAADCARRGYSLLHFLTQNGEHVHSLHIARSIMIPDAQYREAAHLMTACLTACSAAGKLEELSVGVTTPLASTAWLTGLTACRRLLLGHYRLPLRLPPSFSRLTALTDAELAGRPIELGTAASLPPALTRLRLWDPWATTLPHQLTSLSALASLDLDGGTYDADSLAMLARLPALRKLTAGGPRLLPSLSMVTQLEQLTVKSYHDGATSVLAAALPSLSGLTSLCLRIIAPLGSLAAVAQLQRLQRLLLTSSVAHNANADNLVLPPGPWLCSIRWLGLPWPVLEAGVEALRGAPQLEYLYSAGTPKYAIHAAETWCAFWQFVSTHPPLRCLAFAREAGEEAEPVPVALFNVLLTLHHRRPGLQLRQLVEPSGARGEVDTFLFEVTECQGIPTGPGSFEAF